MKGQRAGEAPLLVPTDTLLHLIQIRVSKTGRLNLRASQQYRGRCQLQSLTRHKHTHAGTRTAIISSANQVPPAAGHHPPPVHVQLKVRVLFHAPSLTDTKTHGGTNCKRSMFLSLRLSGTGSTSNDTGGEVRHSIKQGSIKLLTRTKWTYSFVRKSLLECH